MNDKVITALIVAIVVLLVIFMLRKKFTNIKNIKGSLMGARAEIGTHDRDQLIVKGVEQISQNGSNTANIRTTNAKVDGIKQTAHKDNVLDIGNSDHNA